VWSFFEARLFPQIEVLILKPLLKLTDATAGKMEPLRVSIGGHQ